MLSELPRTAGSTSFKQGMRLLAAGVAVIASQDEMGVYLGLTATSVTSLSADPPSLLVCLNRSSTLIQALRKSILFSANVLSEGQVDIAQAFGGQRPVRGMGRFAYGSWFRSDHDVPILGGSRVSFECSVEETVDWATHRIIVGRVCDVHFNAAAASPLIYHNGHYLALR
jgi:flavin reductase (DIM6/NTAB) family NADH-FMN oxidoreductase RutF